MLAMTLLLRLGYFSREQLGFVLWASIILRILYRRAHSRVLPRRSAGGTVQLVSVLPFGFLHLVERVVYFGVGAEPFYFVAPLFAQQIGVPFPIDAMHLAGVNGVRNLVYDSFTNLSVGVFLQKLIQNYR